MRIVAAPTFTWIGPHFACRECGAVVVFDLGDLKDKSFRARESLAFGWQVRARCPVCTKPLAQFRQLNPEAP